MVARRQMSPLQGSEPGSEGGFPIRELDRVRLREGVTGDEGVRIPQGSTGTVVGIYADGAAFEVEFTEPVDALATIEARALSVVERAGD